MVMAPAIGPGPPAALVRGEHAEGSIAQSRAGVALPEPGKSARFLTSLLYAVRPTDPATFALVSLAPIAVSTWGSGSPPLRGT